MELSSEGKRVGLQNKVLGLIEGRVTPIAIVEQAATDIRAYQEGRELDTNFPDILALLDYFYHERDETGRGYCLELIGTLGTEPAGTDSEKIWKDYGILFMYTTFSYPRS